MSVRVPAGPVQPSGFGEDPLTHYTKIFTRFLQYVFASFDPGFYKWLPDPEKTEVLIQDQAGPITAETVEKRPAIIVARGTAAPADLALDHFKSYENNKGTERTHTDLMSCSMNFNCLSKEGLEAQRLAHICFMATKRLRRTIQKAGVHQVGMAMQISAESPPGGIVEGEGAKITMVTVTVPFYYQDQWTIAPLDKTLLNKLELALRSERLVEIREPSINGFTIRFDKVVNLDQRVQAVRKNTPKPRT